jgi:hypothetical protein
LSHLFVPSRKHENINWEANYNQETRHFGVEKEVVVLQKHFYWLKLQQDVRKYIGFCTITKHTIKKNGIYTIQPTSDKPSKSISMDYIYRLPSNNHGNEYIFEVID